MSYTFFPDRIEIPAAELDALLPFTCRDVTRAHLCGVCISEGELFTTDGHTACIVTRCCPNGQAPTTWSKRGHWPAEYVTKQLEVARAGLRGAGKRTASVTLERAALQTEQPAPPIRLVYGETTTTKPATEIGLNPHYLARCEAVAKALIADADHRASRGLRIKVRGALDSVIIRRPRSPSCRCGL